ncbi:MAG TPA: AAA family ATPase, partial [Dongiaceae bacterium]|nr:AAA family ATPase [Dongiaceae bacterium]
MAQLIVLPRLTEFRLTGFQPIFREDVSMVLAEGPNVILGGNGLGKTTIMQAVVFGLTGGADEAIEEEKTLRWNHSYFRGRLNATQLQQAAVEVHFALGKSEFAVRRGLNSPYVIGFRTGRSKKWIDEKGGAQEAFDDALRTSGGYQNPQDFAFIVHRLLYLNETRRLLAWDTTAQVRIFMMLNQDASRESWFYKQRARLKQMDSRKRHIHVALGKARGYLTALMEFEEQTANDDEAEATTVAEPEPNLPILVDQLRRAAKESFEAAELVRVARKNLSELSIEVESLHEQLENVEAALISSFLSEQEKDSSLALYKLLENGICPACGTLDNELRSTAEKNAREHACLLCGSKIPQGTSHELATLRSQLAEKVKAQRISEDSLMLSEAKLGALRAGEDDLQQKVTAIRLQQPVLAVTEPNLPETTRAQLLAQQSDLEKQEADLEAQIYRLQNQLRREFERFRNQVADRRAHLGDLYARYATSF